MLMRNSLSCPVICRKRAWKLTFLNGEELALLNLLRLCLQDLCTFIPWLKKRKKTVSPAAAETSLHLQK